MSFLKGIKILIPLETPTPNRYFFDGLSLSHA